jgi:hypothetical protein
MKKILIAASLAILTPTFVVSTTSCSVVKSLKTVNQISNVAGTANEIASALGVNLGLSGVQKNALTGIFTDYITGTNGIANLSGNSYLNQLGSLNAGTMSKLKSALTTAQYLKLLNLGAGKSTASSLLGGLGSSSLSSDATSVLSGLLLNSIR